MHPCCMPVLIKCLMCFELSPTALLSNCAGIPDSKYSNELYNVLLLQVRYRCFKAKQIPATLVTFNEKVTSILTMILMHHLRIGSFITVSQEQ